MTDGVGVWHVTEINSRGNAADRGVFEDLFLLDAILKDQGYVLDAKAAMSNPANEATWNRTNEASSSNAPDSGIQVNATWYETDVWVSESEFE